MEQDKNANDKSFVVEESANSMIETTFSKETIILIGFMGSGKSTVGRILARELKLGLIEMDDLIEQQQGKKISKIFEEQGEAVFRQIETKFLLDLFNNKPNGIVLSTGGGVITQSENIDLLRSNGKVIYLRGSKEHLKKNVMGSSHRPLLANEDLDQKIEVMLGQREALYRQCAHEIIELDGKTPEMIAQEVKVGIKQYYQ